jgi:hypothetical protein
MFEKLGQKGKTYEEGCEDLRKTMEKAVPAELLEKFDQNARELGEIDFLSRSLKPGEKLRPLRYRTPFSRMFR